MPVTSQCIFIRQRPTYTIPFIFQVSIKSICLDRGYTFVRNKCDNQFTTGNNWGHLWNPAAVFEVLRWEEEE